MVFLFTHRNSLAKGGLNQERRSVREPSGMPGVPVGISMGDYVFRGKHIKG